MTAKELIAQLKTVPPDSLVVLARDSEGNGFSPIANRQGVTEGHYVAHGTSWGDLADDDEEDKGVVAVVLWPIH